MRDKIIQEILERWLSFLRANFHLFDNVVDLTVYLHRLVEADPTTWDLARRIGFGELSSATDDDYIRANETVVKYLGYNKLWKDEMALMETVLQLVGFSELGDFVDCSYTLPGIPHFLLREGICRSAICINPSEGYVRMTNKLGQKVQSGVVSQKGSLYNIPLQESSTDTLLCLETLEWFRSWHQAIPEFARILRPQGKFMITLKQHSFRGEVNPDRVRWYLQDSGLDAQIYQMSPGRLVLVGTKG